MEKWIVCDFFYRRCHKVSDITLEGLDVSRAVYILSDETQKISDVILSEMDRGVTGIQAKGMYTKQEKCMLLCVVSRKQIVWLKETVMEIDPKAFLIYAMQERYGEKDSSRIRRKSKKSVKYGEMHKKNCISSLLFWVFCLKIRMHSKNIREKEN